MKGKYCCESFEDFIPLFNWITYNLEGTKYIMPHIIVNDNYKLRVNHCPSCGAEVRDIELNEI